MSRLEKKLASGEKAALSTRRNVGLDVREDTSPAAQALKAHSPPGKGVPIIYLIAGILPSIRSAVQEMLRRHEYGGVVIDTRASLTQLRNPIRCS